MKSSTIKLIANSIKAVTVIVSTAEAATGHPWAIVVTMSIGAVANEVIDHYKAKAMEEEFKEKYRSDV
jgi:chromosomal replication initiation ATPase DnaA